MPKHICECGRKAVFISHRKRGKVVVAADNNHTPCPRCWQSLVAGGR